MVKELFDIRCQSCGNTATLIQRDSALSQEMIKGLYCPICKDTIAFNPETMTETDDGWVIQDAMNSGAKILGAMDLNGHPPLEPVYLSHQDYTIASFILYPGRKVA